MPTKTTLMLGFHNHQPVGNFDEVFRFSFDHAYVPLLDHLDRHPGVKVALHYTGPLIEWIEEHEPEFLDRVAEIVERGQAEMLSGGFYEPILTVLPQRDAEAQLTMMSEYVKKRFGYDAKGFWLAERVWEPTIPSIAAAGDGLQYTVLDQSHFLSSGIGPDDAHGYYMTEDQGRTLAVFPIDYEMRYTIPWKKVQATINYLRKKHDAQPGRGWTFADDGEKFGSWPETWENVIQTGWFDELFTRIEESSDWLETMTFSEYLDSRPPSGRAYFPTGSYPEMMRWSLPPHVGEEVERFLDELKKRDEAEFVKPGFWRNFMSKYREANTLHKRMIRASDRVDAADTDNETREAARKRVLRSQCNCPYWHGVFGGLYLNFLRHATYAEMLSGEAQADPVDGLRVEQCDYDADGQREIIIENRHQALFISPHTGGAICEWDWRAFPTNLIDTMTRRREVYHAKIADAVVEGQSSSADVSGKTKAKTAGLEDALAYDRYNRWCLIDLFPAAGTTHTDFAGVQYTDEGDFATGAYDASVDEEGSTVTVVMQRAGTLKRGSKEWPVRIEKTITGSADDPGLTVEWTLVNEGDSEWSGTFGSEWNFGLLAGDADDRYVLVNGRRGPGSMKLGTAGTHDDVHEIGVLDHWQQVDIRIALSREAALWRYPVETVSLSEGGYEKTYQATALFPHWQIALAPGERWSVTATVTAGHPEWHEPE